MSGLGFCLFFFFNDTAPTEIYTLSLHDALPISDDCLRVAKKYLHPDQLVTVVVGDRKSTRLNSSHTKTSYAVFCLKKKKKCTPSASRIRGPSHTTRLHARQRPS